MTPRTILQFALGPLGGAALGLVTLPIITWLFSQDDVGRFSMLQVTLSFGTLLFSLGLDQAYVREFHEVNDRPLLLKLVVLPGFALLMVVLLAILVLGPELASWLFSVPSRELSYLVAVCLLATFLSRFLSLVLRMNERALAFSMSQVLPKVLLLFLLCAFIFLDAERSLENLVLANTLALVLVSGFYSWNTRSEWRLAISKKIDPVRTRSLLAFGLPLTLGGLAFWGLTAIDKLFLRLLTSYEQLAVYSVAVSAAAAAAVLQSVFSIVWAPTVYKWASRGEESDKIVDVMRYVLICVITLFSLAGMFSWVVPLLLPSSYEQVQWILVSCMAFPLLYTLSEATVVGIGLSRRSSFAMLAAAIAFVVNVLGNWLLIPMFGASGAAVSTCVSFFMFFILRTEFSAYLWHRFPRSCLYWYSTILVSGAVFTTLFGRSTGHLVVAFWALVLLSVPFVFWKDMLRAYSFVFRR